MTVTSEVTRRKTKIGAKAVVIGTAALLTGGGAAAAVELNNPVTEDTVYADAVADICFTGDAGFQGVAKVDGQKSYLSVSAAKNRGTSLTVTGKGNLINHSDDDQKSSFVGFDAITLHSSSAPVITSKGAGNHIFLGVAPLPRAQFKQGASSEDQDGLAGPDKGYYFYEKDGKTLVDNRDNIPDSITLIADKGAVISADSHHVTAESGEDEYTQIGLYAKDILIEQKNPGTQQARGAAVYLTGETLKDQTNSESGVRNYASAVGVYGPKDGTLVIRSPKRAIYADNGSAFEASFFYDKVAERLGVSQATIDIAGMIEVKEGGEVDLGYGPRDQLYGGWIEGDNEEGDLTESVNELRHKSVVIRGPSAWNGNASQDKVAAVKVSQGGMFQANADRVVIHKGSVAGAAAVQIDTQGSSGTTYGTNLPTIVSIKAHRSLTIIGDIVIDKTDGGDERSIVDIHSDGLYLHAGRVIVKNTRSDGRRTQNIARIDLTDGQSFEGTISDEMTDLTQSTQILRTAALAVQSVEDGEGTEAPFQGAGTYLNLGDGATLNLTGDSRITSLTRAGNGTKDAVIHADFDGTLAIGTLSGDGRVTVETGALSRGKIKLAAQEGAGSLTVTGTTDKTYSASELSNLQVVQFVKMSELFEGSDDAGTGTEGRNLGYRLKVAESAGSPEYGVMIGPDGVTTSDYYVVSNTSVAESLNDIAGLAALSWRAQMNDVDKRLGDLRTYEGASGGWARVYGGKMKYGDRHLTNRSTTLQVGTDVRIARSGYLGAAASYTDGSGHLDNGKTDDATYTFGVYGGWQHENGTFADVIVKVARYSTDFDLAYRTGEKASGSFHTWGGSAAAEFGRRFALKNGFWAEPQAEVTYGVLKSVDYSAKSVSGTARTHQDQLSSFVGRLGLSFGRTYDNGSAYVKASVAHEYCGKAKVSVTNGDDMQQDLSGTWGEFALGGTYRIGRGFSAYGEFSTSVGTPVKAPYQWNVGMRYSF